jgi:hypothetical protein
MSEKDAGNLWSWYRSEGFQSATSWLYARDVRRFNPSAAPLSTAWHKSMIEGARRSDEAMLLDMIRTQQGPFAHGVVAGPLALLVERIQMSTAIRLFDTALVSALVECGWRDVGIISDKASKLDGIRAWAAPHMADVPTPELRRILAEVRGEEFPDHGASRLRKAVS